MRISDWSSDVCSSDLTKQQSFNGGVADPDHEPSRINSRIRQILGRFDQVSYVGYPATPFANIFIPPDAATGNDFQDLFPLDRKSVVSGKSLSVLVVLVVLRCLNKKYNKNKSNK